MHSIRWILIVASAVWGTSAFAEQPATPESDPAATLRDRYVALSQQLENSSIQRGLYLESTDSKHAPRLVMPMRSSSIRLRPWPRLSRRPENWCESLILHLNVQYCRAGTGNGGRQLSVAVGKKTNQPLDDTHRIDFIYTVAVSTPRITRGVELSSLPRGRSTPATICIAMELYRDRRARAHSCTSSIPTPRVSSTRWAASAYFATRGTRQGGLHVDPRMTMILRGWCAASVVRSNATPCATTWQSMPICQVLDSPAPERFGQSLELWFAATERFARQLREVKHDDDISHEARPIPAAAGTPRRPRAQRQARGTASRVD